MRRYRAITLALFFAFGVALAAPPHSQADDAGSILKDFMAGGCPSEGPARVFYLNLVGDPAAIACGREREGGRPTRAESRFLIASVSKLYLAVVLMQLEEDGILGIDDPASDWLPEDIVSALDGLDGVSIASLLTMTSGVPDYLDDAFAESSVADAKAGVSAGAILKKAVLGAAAEPRLFEPGTDFDYSNTNYLLAQLVLETAVNAPMHEVFEDRIFAPTGLTRTRLLGYGIVPGDFVQGFEDFGSGLKPVDKYLTGYGFGDGGLVSTAAEIAMFYQALFEDGVLLNGGSIERLLEDPLGEGYGMGIEIETLPGVGRVLGHSGGDFGFSAEVRYLPKQGVTVVCLSAEADDDLSVALDLLEELP